MRTEHLKNVLSIYYLGFGEVNKVWFKEQSLIPWASQGTSEVELDTIRQELSGRGVLAKLGQASGPGQGEIGQPPKVSPVAFSKCCKNYCPPGGPLGSERKHGCALDSLHRNQPE